MVWNSRENERNKLKKHILNRCYEILNKSWIKKDILVLDEKRFGLEGFLVAADV